jgi:hypothetical protein
LRRGVSPKLHVALLLCLTVCHYPLTPAQSACGAGSRGSVGLPLCIRGRHHARYAGVFGAAAVLHSIVVRYRACVPRRCRCVVGHKPTAHRHRHNNNTNMRTCMCRWHAEGAAAAAVEPPRVVQRSASASDIARKLAAQAGARSECVASVVSCPPACEC